MKSHHRTRSSTLRRTVACLVALGFLGACSSEARQGALADTAASPDVSCTAGLGGVTRVSGLGSTFDSMRFTWGFQPSYLPWQDVGLRDPNNPSATPSPSAQITSPPYSSTTSVQTMNVTVKYVFTDSSTVTRTYPCTKTGTDTPTLSITCDNIGINPFYLGSYGKVVVRQAELDLYPLDLAREGEYQVTAMWWWRYLPTWVAVLQPWTLADVPTWANTVAFAGGTAHNVVPSSKLLGSKETQTFKSNVSLPLPAGASAALYGHVRVEVLHRGQPVSFRSEIDCRDAGV